MTRKQRIDKTFIESIIEAEKFGGRVITLHQGDVLVYDCNHWTDQHTAKVKRKYPGCTVDIENSFSSCTGFLISISPTPNQGGVKWGLFFLMAAGSIAGACYYLLYDL